MSCRQCLGTAAVVASVAVAATAVAPCGAEETVRGSASSDDTSPEKAETARIELKLESGQTKSAQVSSGQSARDIFARLRPARAAADDDPWLAYAASDGGHYVLFFREDGAVEAMRGRPDPQRGRLYAVMRYPDDSPENGAYLLPKSMQHVAAGEFVALKVRLDRRQARAASVTQGMSVKDVMKLFRPAADLAVQDDAIVFESVDEDGGGYLLRFAPPEDGDKRATLTDVMYRPGREAKPIYLLPRAKRDESVPPSLMEMLVESLDDADPA